MKLIQVQSGVATYKCVRGHVATYDIPNPFDPTEPASERECGTCEEDAMYTYLVSGINDYS